VVVEDLPLRRGELLTIALPTIGIADTAPKIVEALGGSSQMVAAQHGVIMIISASDRQATVCLHSKTEIQDNYHYQELSDPMLNR